MTNDNLTFQLPANFACFPARPPSIMTAAGGVSPWIRIQEPAMRRWFAAFVLVVSLLCSASPADAFWHHRGWGCGYRGYGGYGWGGGYRGYGWGGYGYGGFGCYRGFGFGLR